MKNAPPFGDALFMEARPDDSYAMRTRSARNRFLRATPWRPNRVAAQLSRFESQSEALSMKSKTPRWGVLDFMAGPTGFEPAISSVTGRRDRPTSLRAPIDFAYFKSVK